MYVLIVITYLGGSAWGPVVSMQEFASKQNCIAAKSAVVEQYNALASSNVAGGVSRRDVVNASCVPK